MKISETGLPTLDHLHVLTAIADEGSFSAAARRLNRAQSVISYAIATLEAQLGLKLLDRSQRLPVLTDAGRAVLADARRMSLMMDELRARAAGMSRGLESEVSLVVDVMFSTDILVAALQDFANAFPTVALRLRIEALGGVMQLVMDGTCGLGIGGMLFGQTDMLTRRRLGTVRLVPVAAPQHPLANGRRIPLAELRDHVQLVLTDRSSLTEGRDFAVFALRTWRLGDLGAKHALLRAGLGWGSMPEAMVAEDIAAGRLVRLSLEDLDAEPYPQYLIHRTDTPPGPAARWLAERLEQPGEAYAPGRASAAT
jgi:DNA-binding transcriptional LysR family regulator